MLILCMFILVSGDPNQPNADTDLGGGCRGCAPLPEMIYCFLIQLVFAKKMWFIGVSYVIS